MKMKKKVKDFLWLGIGIATFVLFLIAMLVIGFKNKTAFGTGSVDSLTNLINKSNQAGAPDYIKNSVGVLISGLVFSALTIFLVSTKIILDFKKVKMLRGFWDFIFFGILILSAILMISGSGLYVNETVKLREQFSGFSETSIKAGDIFDNGSLAGLFILEILPIPFAILPLFIKETRK